MHIACAGVDGVMEMTVVQVRDVPVDVVATLKARADARGESLAAFLRNLLAQEASMPPIEDVMADIEAREPIYLTAEDLRAFPEHGRQ
jgi:plasmid stability protein